jgi:hypothetical protein
LQLRPRRFRLFHQIGLEADAHGTPVAAVDGDRHRQVVENFAGVANIGLEQRRFLVLGQLEADRVVEDALVAAFARSTAGSPLGALENWPLCAGA